MLHYLWQWLASWFFWSRPYSPYSLEKGRFVAWSKAYSPECLEEEKFCELRLLGVLGSCPSRALRYICHPADARESARYLACVGERTFGKGVRML